jgi:hypothetical protein
MKTIISRPRRRALIAAALAAIAVATGAAAHTSGSFHYHPGQSYYVQLSGEPEPGMFPTGTHGIHGWFQVDSMIQNGTMVDDHSTQFHWLSVVALNSSGGERFWGQIGHTFNGSGPLGVFMYLDPGPNPTLPAFQCRNGAALTYGGRGCYADNLSAFGVSAGGWYQVYIEDLWEDGRWKVNFRINNASLAVVDYDAAWGFGYPYATTEMWNSAGTTLETLQQRGMEFRGYYVAFDYWNLGSSQYTMTPGRTVIKSSQDDRTGNASFGSIGCNAGFRQTAGWYFGRNDSHAHGEVAGGCHPWGTILP